MCIMSIIVATSADHFLLYDYTKGSLDTLVATFIENSANLILYTVRVAIKPIINRLYKHKIICVNVIGHLKNA